MCEHLVGTIDLWYSRGLVPNWPLDPTPAHPALGEAAQR